MSLDIVPAGFSSAAAAKLLHRMQSTLDGARASAHRPATAAVDARPAASVSGDALFSILAAAAKASASDGGSAPAPATHRFATSDSPWLHSPPGTAPDDAMRGEDLMAQDLYFQKSYTTEQSVDIFYGESQIWSEFAKRSDASFAGASTGAVVADMYGLSGDRATSFAAAYDARTLTFASPNATIPGLDLVQVHDVFFDGDGNPTGESGGQTFDQGVYEAYQADHPNTILGGNDYFGSWQGVLISW